MRYEIDPGKERRTINFIDNICYSHVTDKNGKPLDLYLSLMLQNGNSEMRLASGRDDEVSTGRQPLIVWINGSGWRSCDKNLMTAEMEFLAEAGYAVAFLYYRASDEKCFPAQIIDVKTAVRFLRAHADKYSIDPERVGTIGRSAGGHLSAWMAMNVDDFHSEEWREQPDTVSASVNMFGPVDLKTLALGEMKRFDDPKFRWHSLPETHGGALMGGEEATILERMDSASPIFAVNDGMAPLLIVHGDQDPLVPLSVSEDFYDRIVKAGLEDRADLVVVKNGGHGTRELFQAQTKGIILDFFNKYLRG